MPRWCIRPSGDLPEVLPDFLLGGGDQLTVRAYVELIRKAKTRFAHRRHPAASRRHQLAVLGQAAGAARGDRRLQDVSGKYVYAWLEYGGDREYFLASVADKVYLLPSASLDLTGVASYEVFLRGTFDWIGTYPDFLHVGDYKTAVNTYLEKTFTPAHKEMSESLNRSQYDQLVDAIAEARGKSEAEVRALIDQGPFQPVEALRVGLIDEVAYEDELDDLVPKLKGADLHRRRGLRVGVVGTHRRAPPLEDRRDQCLRRDQFRQQRLRSGQRRGASDRIRSSSTSAMRAPTRRSRRSCCASTVLADRRRPPT